MLASNLIFGLVTRRGRIRIELHLSRNAMSRDETLQRTDLTSQSDFIDLRDDRVQDLAFEGSENNGAVFDRIDDESATWLNQSGTDCLDSSDHYNESIPRIVILNI